MGSIASRLNALMNGEDLNKQAKERATHAVIDGVATLDEYRIVLGRDAKKSLKRWIPTLTVSATRRELDLPRGTQLPVGVARWPKPAGEVDGQPRLPWNSLPGEVLSYHPGETLLPEVTEQLGELDSLLLGPTEPPEERDVAAVARLVIGPGQGLKRREALWMGKCQAQARDQVCDYERWWDAGLLGIWPQLATFLATHAQPPVADFNQATHKLTAPYEAFELAMREMSGAKRGP
jgi:hypothetical protein